MAIFLHLHKKKVRKYVNDSGPRSLSLIFKPHLPPTTTIQKSWWHSLTSTIILPLSLAFPSTRTLPSSFEHLAVFLCTYRSFTSRPREMALASKKSWFNTKMSERTNDSRASWWSLATCTRPLHISLMSTASLQLFSGSSTPSSPKSLTKLSLHLILGRPTGLFLSMVPSITLLGILSSSVLATCPADWIIRDLLWLVIRGCLVKDLSSSLCLLLQPPSLMS